MRKLLPILFLGVLLTACKKDRLVGEKEMLIGKWEWVYSEMKFSYCNPPATNIEVLTPQSISKKYAVEFIDKGKVAFYEDGQKKEKNRLTSFTWKENKDSTIFTNNQTARAFSVLLNNDLETQLVGVVTSDSLLLFGYYFPYVSDACTLYRSYFTKQ